MGFHTLLSWGPHQAGTSLGASPAQDMPRVAGMCGSMCKCVCERERDSAFLRAPEEEGEPSLFNTPPTQIA